MDVNETDNPDRVADERTEFQTEWPMNGQNYIRAEPGFNDHFPTLILSYS